MMIRGFIGIVTLQTLARRADVAALTGGAWAGDR